MVKRKVDEESQKIRKSIEEDMNKDLSNLEVYYQLPKEGRSGEEVFSEANSYFMLGMLFKQARFLCNSLMV